MAMPFVRAITCPNCGEIVTENGLITDYEVDAGIVRLDKFSNTSLYCENCNTEIILKSLEDMIESTKYVYLLESDSEDEENEEEEDIDG